MFIVNYVDEAGSNIGTGKITIPSLNSSFESALLDDIPEGYVVVTPGSVQVNEDGVATVVVKLEKEAPAPV